VSFRGSFGSHLGCGQGKFLGRQPSQGSVRSALIVLPPPSLDLGPRVAEAACWARVRRKYFDVHAATGSPIVKEALDRIGQFYGIPPLAAAFSGLAE